MRLHDLKPPSGSRRPRRRVGRGVGSGMGKTSGRGQKGQKARSGFKQSPGFEGGQLPLAQRVPKRGFRNRFRKEYAAVNVEALNRFESGTVITPELLREEGVIKTFKDGVKILGSGELEKTLTVKANSFSAGAKEKIENAGGQAEVI